MFLIKKMTMVTVMAIAIVVTMYARQAGRSAKSEVWMIYKTVLRCCCGRLVSENAAKFRRKS